MIAIRHDAEETHDRPQTGVFQGQLAIIPDPVTRIWVPKHIKACLVGQKVYGTPTVRTLVETDGQRRPEAGVRPVAGSCGHLEPLERHPTQAQHVVECLEPLQGFQPVPLRGRRQGCGGPGEAQVMAPLCSRKYVPRFVASRSGLHKALLKLLEGFGHEVRQELRCAYTSTQGTRVWLNAGQQRG